MSASTSPVLLRREILLAAEEGLADRRRERRIAYWLAKRNLRLQTQRNGYFAIDRYTGIVEFYAESSIAMETWARERAS